MATRSAGPGLDRLSGASTSWCRPCAARRPPGALDTRDVPASGAGPSLRELVVGSEGVLGVITAATLRVREAPRARRYEAWSVGTFAQGAEAMRRLEQAGAHPDVCRLSDEAETQLTAAMGSSGGRAERLGRTYLRLRGQEDGCLLIAGFEGSDDDVTRRRGRFAEMLRAAGGVFLGERWGSAWLDGPLRRPLPARRADGPRRHGRHAGDGLPVVGARQATHEAVGARHPGGAGRARHPGPGHVPRLAPVPHRARRCTSRSSPRRSAAPSWTSGGRPRPPPATPSPRPAPRSPTTTPWGATTARGWRPRSARWAWRPCAR